MHRLWLIYSDVELYIIMVVDISNCRLLSSNPSAVARYIIFKKLQTPYKRDIWHQLERILPGSLDHWILS